MKKKPWVLTGIFLAGSIFGIWTADRFYFTGNFHRQGSGVTEREQPEISGWVAWWKEEPAYRLVASQSGRIKTVSPVWWLINENLEPEDVGKSDRKKVAAQLRSLGIKIYPTLGSELTGRKLSPLFNDGEKSDQLIAMLLIKTLGLEIDGLDIDLEGIAETDKESFVKFLSKLKKITRDQKWKLSVTIQAQDGKNLWFGAGGQDIAKIAEIADEVRIMAYDRHSVASGPGPIAPRDWVEEVVRYNLKLIPKEKIVIGIPSYGYIWPKTGNPAGLQRDEIYEYLGDKKYEVVRDMESGELQITGDGFTGWLSDGEAMAVKINQYRKWGLNRFVIWHLGGMDEEVYTKFWPGN